MSRDVMARAEARLLPGHDSFGPAAYRGLTGEPNLQRLEGDLPLQDFSQKRK